MDGMEGWDGMIGWKWMEWNGMEGMIGWNGWDGTQRTCCMGERRAHSLLFRLLILLLGLLLGIILRTTTPLDRMCPGASLPEAEKLQILKDKGRAALDNQKGVAWTEQVSASTQDCFRSFLLLLCLV